MLHTKKMLLPFLVWDNQKDDAVDRVYTMLDTDTVEG